MQQDTTTIDDTAEEVTGTVEFWKLFKAVSVLTGVTVGQYAAAVGRKAMEAYDAIDPDVRRNVALFEALRVTRLEMARERQLPAYCIATDRTLRKIATHRPRTTLELAEIHGMGPTKLFTVGERLLEVVERSG